MKSFTLIVLLCFLISGITAQDKFHLSETYKINATGTLYLDSEDAEVTITATDRNDVLVKVERIRKFKGLASKNYDRFEFNITERGGDLYLKEHSESNFSFMIGSISEDYNIDIEVPNKVTLDLTGEDDNYFLYNIGGDLEIENEDGDTEIKNYQGSNIDYQGEDGDLNIDQGKGKISVDTDDGDISIKNGDFEIVYVTVEDGDVEFVTNLVPNGTYVFKSEDGRMELIFPQGGGTIEISHDDCDIRTTQNYNVVTDTESKTVVQTNKSAGDANVRIVTEDGSLRIGH